MAPHASVLLATRNRASILEASLTEYCRLEAPPGGWELVIVDNGSVDATESVVRAFQARLPIKYCVEPTPGKNAALNQGLQHIDGDLIVFTDDDVFPRSDWLVEVCAAAASHPTYSIFAGIIAPRWEVQPPDLIRRAVPLDICYAVHPPSMKEGPSKPDLAWGGNVAIRAEVFRRGYRFDPSTGPRPGLYSMGGETELMRRLVRDGLTVWCCERAVVEHLVPVRHLRVSWILGRATHYGRRDARLEARDSPHTGPTWFGIPRWRFRALAGHVVDATRATMSRDPTKVLRARWRLHEELGAMLELRAMRTANRASAQTTPTLP